MSRHVELIKENIIQHFVEAAQAYQRRIRRVYIVSPWISHANGGYDAVSNIVDLLESRRKITALIITRPPVDVWHTRSLVSLAQTKQNTIMTLPHLHTKLYILDCEGFRLALMGSPNFTQKADSKNSEIAVEFRSTTEIEETPEAEIITALIAYTNEMSEHERCKLYVRDR